MKGVSTGTGGRQAARGCCRAFPCAGVALVGLLVWGFFDSGMCWADGEDDPFLAPPMSPRAIRQGEDAAQFDRPDESPPPRRARPAERARRAEPAPPETLPPADPNREPATRFPEEGEKLVDVLVEGNDTIPSAAILQKIKTQPGRPADSRQIQGDIRALFGTRWFLDVATVYRRTEKGLVLVFRVVERPVVRSVQYLGNKQVKTKVLASQTGLKPGSPFDISANREAAKRLESYYHDQGYPFATVDLESGEKRDDRDVAFRIVEGPKSKVVWRSFEGNRAFNDDLLNMQLKTKSAIFGLVGGKYDPANIPEDVAAVRHYYETLGYFDAKVEPDIQFSKDRKWVRANFKVQEGLHYRIRDITVSGNVRFTEQDLLKDLKLQQKQYFNARLLNKDVANIKKKYGELGYTFAAVEIVPRFLEEPGLVDLVLRIDEDKPYSIRMINFHIEGDHPRTKRTVPANYVGLAPGDPADPAKIDKSKRKLGNAQVFKVDPNGGQVKVVIRRVTDDVAEKKGPNYRGQNGDDDDVVVAAVSRRAASRTALAELPAFQNVERPLARVADAAPMADEPYYPGYAEEDWIGQVVRSQSPDDPFAVPANPLFENSPQGDPYGEIRRTPQGEIDLDYYLAEERTGRLMFGVGVNSSAGLVGSIVLQEQNFDILRPPTSWADVVNGTAWRGNGQRFRVEAIPGTQVSRYTVSWSDPYFLNSDYSVGLSGFYFQRFYRDWTEERAGGRITAGRQFSQTLSVTGALRLEDVKIFNPRTPTPPILEEVVGDNFLSTARASIAHDTRDSAFLPGEGHRVELSYEQGFGQFVYPRAELDARQHFTIYRRPDGGGRQILTVGGQLGWTDSGTPIFERYYAGGFQNFRGFQFRGVSPRQLDVQVGGRWMALGSVEYTVPLLVNEMIQGVVFSDFGTVDEHVTLDDFRLTVGAGLRIAIPAMGPVPLAFDFGVPILKQKDDITQVFSFYVGLTR